MSSCKRCMSKNCEECENIKVMRKEYKRLKKKLKEVHCEKCQHVIKHKKKKEKMKTEVERRNRRSSETFKVYEHAATGELEVAMTRARSRQNKRGFY